MTAQRKPRKKKRPETGAHRVVVRGSRHDPPDARKLAAVIVSLAESLAETDNEKNTFTPETAIIPIIDNAPEGNSEAA
ncbi:hypothetical protein [Nocardia macrotermitis]|uniref:Uncharacterized protein n=1 Tax=Nocardia macrotermitis TaxID=2585198 RepID=A0A7K0DB73_9NOCA|nr:hypothetical protein [Nocardia macrotermitis]MQY23030.1 hypothetical protein [Nocardia macrotermitis]